MKIAIFRDNKGQALVEMALVITIFLLILSGIIEFGRIFSAQLIVTHASREAARYGVINPGDSNEIVNKAENASGVLDINKVSVVIFPLDLSARRRGEQLTVQVEYPVAIIMPFIGGILSNPYTVRGITKMRIE